jgi:hypothetical protein
LGPKDSRIQAFKKTVLAKQNKTKKTKERSKSLDSLSEKRGTKKES